MKVRTSESAKVIKSESEKEWVLNPKNRNNDLANNSSCTLSLRILVLSLLPEGGRYPTILGSDIIKTRQSSNHKTLHRRIRKIRKRITHEKKTEEKN